MLRKVLLLFGILLFLCGCTTGSSVSTVDLSSPEANEEQKPEADFDTSFVWIDTETSETHITVSYCFNSGDMDQDYEQINKEDIISIDNKAMICLPINETELCLLQDQAFLNSFHIYVSKSE